MKLIQHILNRLKGAELGQEGLTATIAKSLQVFKSILNHLSSQNQEELLATKSKIGRVISVWQGVEGLQIFTHLKGQKSLNSGESLARRRSDAEVLNSENSANSIRPQPDLNSNHETNHLQESILESDFSRRFGFALHRIFTVFHAFKSSYKSCSSLLKTVFLKSAIVLGRRRKPISLSSPYLPLFVSISGSAFSSLARPSSSFTLELLW